MSPFTFNALRILLPLCAAFLSGWTALGRDSYFTVTWDSDEGLPHNGVHRIVQTPDRFLWLGTSGGLARFDGLQFRGIDSPLLRNRQSESVRYILSGDGLPLLAAPSVGGLFVVNNRGVEAHAAAAALGNERIASMYLARDQRLWLSMSGGFIGWLKDGEFGRVGKLHNSGSGRVTMAEDEGGRLWVAVGDYFGFWADSVFQRVNPGLSLSLYLTPARQGLWLAGDDGLQLMRGTSVVRRIEWPASMSRVNTMLETSDGNLWVGTTDSGLYRMEGGRFYPGPATHPEVACLFEDHERNLWAGTTGGGIYLVRKRYVEVFDSRTGLPQDVSFSICQDREGGVWFANRSEGLVRWHQGKFTRAQHTATDLPGATVVNQGPDGSIYMGTESGLFQLPAGTTNVAREVRYLRGQSIRFLFTSSAGDLWVAARARHFGKVVGTNFFPVALDKPEEVAVTSLDEDAAGRVIAGTSSGDVFRETTDGFEKLSGLPEGLATVNVIASQPDGTLWIGTAGSGLVRWKEGLCAIIDQERGLPDDAVSQLLWENPMTLWGCSRSGIWRVSLHELERATRNRNERIYPVVLGRRDGAPAASGIGSQRPVGFVARDGRLWFATRRGVVRVNPAGFAETGRELPAFVEAFKVDGVMQPLSGEVRILPSATRYEFAFNAVHLSGAERVSFRYRLQGLDADWVNAGQRREASYMRLGPGTYRFEAQARDPRGRWSRESAAVGFVVPPAWWQRAWVQALLVIGGSGLVAGVVRFAVARRYRRQIETMKQKQAVEVERARIARDLHDDLGAGLTYLAHLGHLANARCGADELRASLQRVSSGARALSMQMDAIVWTVNPKNDTLSHVAEYLSHFGREFFQNSALRFRVDRPEELPVVPCSPEARHHILMIVKEAFNNAAKHSRGDEVWLRVRVQGERLIIEVEDNGRGLNQCEQREGDGLANMRTRAEELGGSIEYGSGRVCLSVPLSVQEERIG